MTPYPSKRVFNQRQELPISHNGKDHPTVSKYSVLSIKQWSLIILVIQNSMLVLLMRYSRTLPSDDQPMYIASTAVWVVEILKLTACCCMVKYLYPRSFTQVLLLETLHKPQDMMKMLIPSALYAIQNNLLYLALTHLEAATFQITYQLKILSTAAFSIGLLGRSVHRIQWIALILLMIGVTLVQTENMKPYQIESSQPLLGLFAVLFSCLSSGFAGCYFEKILKTTTTSMWIRNIQLGICGLVFSFVTMIPDYSLIYHQGFFGGYNTVTWCVIINQALGGLLVSVVVKYADNILKGFATSISIILSSMISYLFLDFQPSLVFITGTCLVISATVLYAY
ncbi:solute carrier family 35 member 3A [Pilobolus umbonatus]|nr:solute carrier family 35 member 3A [Pilobolus umbonatus]